MQLPRLHRKWVLSRDGEFIGHYSTKRAARHKAEQEEFGTELRITDLEELP
jgi:hypothetical protein